MTACSAVNARQQMAFARTPDFLTSGNPTTPYNNLMDLWIWPPDAYYSAGKPAVVVDATSESGSYFISSYARGGQPINAIDGLPLIVGQHIPASKTRIYIRLKAASGTPRQTINILAGVTNIASISPMLSTSYSTVSVDADYSAYSGRGATIAFNRAGTDVYVAWIAIVPWRASELVNGPLTITPAATVQNGTAGTVTCSQSMNGALKIATCYLNRYLETSAAQTFTFSPAFSTYPILLKAGAGGNSCGTYNPSATATTLTLPANAAMAAETCNITAIGQ
jgi:hypothetical protein